jgi:hypothetical protein
MHWKTDIILEKLKQIPEVKIYLDFPGGDVDTTVIILTKNDYRLFVSGFTTGTFPEIPNSNPNDMDIEMVEITDGEDSKGGCNSYREEDMIFYYKVKKILHDMGFETVDNMKNYF